MAHTFAYCFFYLNFREVCKLWAVAEIHLRMEGVTDYLE